MTLLLGALRLVATLLLLLGLGSLILDEWRRLPPAPQRPRVERRAHSPTTPLAFLEEWEWQLWTSVIAERTQ